MAIKLYTRKKIYRVDHAPCPGQKIFATRMLTRDLFAMAGLVFISFRPRMSECAGAWCCVGC